MSRELPALDTAGARADGDYSMLHAAAMLSLVCVGVYAGAFGPVLPFLADDLGISLDTAGLILTALFVGSIAASATIALALHGRDTRLLTMAGLVAIVAGTLLLAFAPTWPLALAGGVVLGAGDGLVIAALHILMAATSRDVPAGINRLNLFFAFGAMAGPLWAGAVLSLTGERSIVYCGIALLAATALVFVAAAPAPGLAAATPDEEFRLPGNPIAWTMGILLFLYVGAEFGLGSWVSSYARQSAGAGVFGGALLTAGFWMALALGRIGSGFYFARRSDVSFLLIVTIAGAGIASLLLALASGNIFLSAVGAFGAGLCFGPIWPATVAITSQAGTANATATTVTMGNAGGLVLPWLQGKVLVGAGPGQGVAVTAVLCALMFCIVSGFRFVRARDA